MTLRKLNGPDVSRWTGYGTACVHPEHKPPGMIVLEPGTWEHTCPACGEKTVFRVERPTW